MTLKQITPDQVASFTYEAVEAKALQDARAIVDDVRANGLPALRAQAARLGDIASPDQDILIPKEALKAA
ncbi:TPA: hypothetical protein N0F65_009593, partial [Lagenidium giganteum]